MTKKDLNFITKNSLLMADIEHGLDNLSIETLTILRQKIENKIENKKLLKTIQDFNPHSN